jgi:Asp/Glu/hydantoin racemase
MRIKYIVPFAWGGQGVAARDGLVPRGALSPGTEVETVAVRNHPVEGGTLVTYYESALLDAFMLDAAVGSEAEGYDAVVMDTSSDSALYALRSRLTIPVLGASIASYAVAGLLGPRFGIVCYREEHRRFYESKLELYHARDRCVSIRACGVVPDYEALFDDGDEPEFERLTAAARQAIELDGAEVIVLGSTTMAQAQPYIAARVQAPVINPGAVAIKLAETLVALGLSHSKLSFESPRAVQDAVWAAAATATAPGRER